jgi:hypothetical protein
MAVRDRLGIDLLQPESPRRDDPDGPPALTLLGTDEMLLGEVLCLMLEGQFASHGVTAEEVRGVFDGETLLAAQRAFYEELVVFFRGRGRTDRAKAVAKQMGMIDAAVKAIETRLDRIDPRKLAEDAIETQDKTSGGGPPSGRSPERSPSPPEVTASAD